MRSRWAPLPQRQQDEVVGLLRDVVRGVVGGLVAEEEGGEGGRRAAEKLRTRREEAEGVLNRVVRRLEERVPDMPFPKGGKGMVAGSGTGKSTKTEAGGGWEVGRVAEENNILEHRLTTALHAVELLKAEITGEEERLEADRKRLARLTASVRADEKRARKEITTVSALCRCCPYRSCLLISKQVHPLLKDQPDVTQLEDSAERLALVAQPKEADEILLDGLHDDPDLAPVLEQLRHHLETMRANTAQVQGVSEAVDSTRAKLGKALFEHGGREAFMSATNAK